MYFTDIFLLLTWDPSVWITECIGDVKQLERLRFLRKHIDIRVGMQGLRAAYAAGNFCRSFLLTKGSTSWQGCPSWEGRSTSNYSAPFLRGAAPTQSRRTERNFLPYWKLTYGMSERTESLKKRKKNMENLYFLNWQSPVVNNCLVSGNNILVRVEIKLYFKTKIHSSVGIFSTILSFALNSRV